MCVRAIPGLKIQTWGTHGRGEFAGGMLGFVLSHPSHKNKDVARMGHPNIVGIYLPKQ
jgi:hypothetical protein